MSDNIIVSRKVIEQALKALETCDWDDNQFPDDTQYFDRFAVYESATAIRTTLATAEPADEITRLRQQLAERDAEIDRLRTENELYAAEMSAAKEAGFYSAQELFGVYQKAEAELAAAQETIVAKDEALERIGDTACGEASHQFIALEALALPADRTALDAMLAEARKEGMLKAAEQFAEPYQSYENKWIVDAIRQAAERSEE